MKDLLLLLHLVVVITVTYYTSAAVRAQSDLQPLGTADGKSFYYNKAVSRKWDVAVQFCKFHGLNLASFDTAAQLDLIVNSAIADFDLNIYWTSARDSTEASHYKWNDAAGSSVDLFGMDYQYPPQYENCLRFYKLGSRSHFTVSSCQDATAKTICAD